MGTPGNAQNNYIKLNGFGFNKTGWWETNKKFLSSKNPFAVQIFITDLSEFSQNFLFYCRLNSTGNDLFTGKAEISR